MAMMTQEVQTLKVKKRIKVVVENHVQMMKRKIQRQMKMCHHLDKKLEYHCDPEVNDHKECSGKVIGKS
jgi:hypothetical protein